MVSTAALKPGPIDFLVAETPTTATGRALLASLPVQESDDLGGMNSGQLKPEPIQQSTKTQGATGLGLHQSFPDEEGDDEGFQLYAAVSAFLLVCVGVVAIARRPNQANDEDRHALEKKNSFHGVILLSMLGICMIGEAGADDCTVDCNAFGTPLPNQTLFVNELFIPEVQDLRTQCDTHIDIYININENYDWGITDDSGAALNTTLYGYVLRSP